MTSRVVTSGRPLYGHAVGILMQNDAIVRLPGDVGNATTFEFPVRYALVSGVGTILRIRRILSALLLAILMLQDG
jgi:hypothetical protein